jgi:hypothetical protein
MYSKFGEAEQIPNQALADYDECGQFLALIKSSPKDLFGIPRRQFDPIRKGNTMKPTFSTQLTVGCLSWDRGTLQ